MVDLERMPSKVDYTMMSTFDTCKRKYHYRMVRGLVGKRPQVAPEFGRCMHLALDEWYSSHDLVKCQELFASVFVEDESDDKRTIAVGHKLLELYSVKYAHEPFTVVKTEMGFDIPLLGSTHLIGRIDKIIDWAGVIWVVDHKTTSRLGYAFFNKLKPNMQFDGYVFAARALGYPAVGAMIDALLTAKGLTTPSQLARLTPLARDTSDRSDADLEEYLDDVDEILGDMKHCYELDEWHRSTDRCTDFGECPYRRVCKESQDVRERIIAMDYRVEPWDPLKHSKDGGGEKSGTDNSSTT